MEDAQRKFRDAVGTFPTGVTVITTVNAEGKPKAMTANSFTSLSLDPPLILWNVGDHADGYDDFKNAKHFAVHILHAGQQDTSNHFAKKNDDKFAGLDWSEGVAGSPVLSDYHTCIQCTMEAVHPGGDHLIIVGRVVNMDNRSESSEPLLFYKGKYRQLAD
jgi:flavin reductase (DIM6/NTAB) family NADH-FMN oxidoreductase RutF